MASRISAGCARAITAPFMRAYLFRGSQHRMLAIARAEPVVIKVEGMVCGGCSSRVQEALDKDPLIAKATVSLDKGEAVVELKGVSGDEAKAAVSKLVQQIEDMGFDAKAADA